MIGGARDQYGSLANVQTSIKHKIKRTAKRPSALIVSKTHLAQGHLARKAIQRVHSWSAPGIEITGHNHRAAVMRNLIANRK